MRKYSLKAFCRGLNPVAKISAIMLPLLALAVSLIQPALAETTYYINDGSRYMVYSSTASTPTEILDEAGFVVGDQDQIFTNVEDGISEITIQRAQSIEIYNCGHLILAISSGETVGDLLERYNIIIDANTVVSSSLDEETFDGMKISINRVVSQEESYSVDIPFHIIRIEDDSLPLGQEEIVREGRMGECVYTDLVFYQNGVETGREFIDEQTMVEPIDCVIAVGSLDVTVPAEPVIVEYTENYGGGTIELPSGEILSYTSKLDVMGTAYTCEGWDTEGITATGTVARVGEIAVDPNLIPLGSRVFVRSLDGNYIYGVATAEDTGGLIIGHRIDLYMDTVAECIQFGYRPCEVYILG